MSFLDGDSMGAMEKHCFTIYWVAAEFINFVADYLLKIVENAFSDRGI